MHSQHYEEPSGASGIICPVITPKIQAASSCPIPNCQSCELAHTKQQNPKVHKSKEIPLKQGVISADKYLPGNFVSMDQYVVRVPGRFPDKYGCEQERNMFHGGTIFVMLLLRLSMSRTKSRWAPVTQSCPSYA